MPKTPPPHRRRSGASVLAAGVVLALAASGIAGQTPSPSPGTHASVLIHAGRVLNVNDGQYLRDAGILVTDGSIAEVGSFAVVRKHAPDAQLIDLATATVLPGLIDCHTHLLMTESMQTLVGMSTAERTLLGAATAHDALLAGVTTVRDLGNSAINGDVALRNGIRAGWVAGPRVIAATRALSPIGGQFDSMGSPAAAAIVAEEYVPVTTPEEGTRAVAAAVFAGADVIKVIVDAGLRENYTAILSEATMRAIVEEAHRSRRKVAAHAIMNAAVRVAALAGVDSIEHAYFGSDSNLELMKDKNIYLVPTDSENPPAYYLDRLRRARAMGVKIAFGSDARGSSVLKQSKTTFVERSLGTLIAYQKAGLTPLEIIQSATVNAADLLGWRDAADAFEPSERKFAVDEATMWQDRLGAVEAGRYADLIAVDGDPLTDLAVLKNVRFVMKQGVVVKGP
jgi:imidazolonepropionase-like amidohydrolase